MVGVQGERIRWADVPAVVRSGIEDLLGSAVVKNSPQGGGFSPGAAERLVLADGRRAFVKAGGLALNEHTPGMYRREGEITAALPMEVPATHLIDMYDDGDWVALILEDVEGRHPHVPWHDDEVGAVLATLDELAADLTPLPDIDVPAAEEALALDAAGYRRLVDAGRVGELLPDEQAHLDELLELAERGLDAIAGNTLVHMDIRADNMLVRRDGSVVILDWPHACRGSAWLDSLCLLLNVAVYGEPDVERWISSTRLLREAEPERLDAALGLLISYFAHAWRQPPPPGLPTVREWQRRQFEVILPWLGHRRGWKATTTSGR